MPAPRRRSFSQQNLDVRHTGPLGALLAEALTVPQASGYTLTHAFHPYPGRFHPHLPRTVLRGVLRESSGRGTRVLDPFMGGGTTLVEARLAGLPSVGNDLNPIAVLVARERTRPRTAAQALHVLSEARRIAGQVQALSREKNAPRVQLPALHRLTPNYAPHLLAELMQWIRLIDGLPAGGVRETLRAVFSSGAVKYSNQATDSSPEERKTPTIAKGAPSRFLVLKT
ncbi:MAG: DNA methyltransferase, partial [SAR324 cluster bacterium]